MLRFYRYFLLLLLFNPLSANECIITLSPALAEIVSALGSENEIVGVSKYSLFPKTLSKKVVVGGYFNMDIEKMLSLKPTLVIGLIHQKKSLDKMQKFGVKSLSFKLERIVDIKSTIKRLGAILKKERQAKILISNIERVTKIYKHQNSKKKVLIVFASSSGLDKGVYVAGHNLYFEEILHICGNQNAFSSNYNSQPVLHYEELLSLDIDKILLLFGPQDVFDKKKVLDSWRVLNLKADIEIIQSDYLLIPSQRVYKSIQTICESTR